MGTLLLNRAFLPRLSAQRFSYSIISSDPCSWPLPARPSCILRAAFSRKLVLHLPSRCLGDDNAILKDEGGDSLASSSTQRSGLACRSKAHSNSYENFSEDGARMDRENRAVRAIHAIGEFASANFLLVALFSSVVFGLAWPAPGRVAQQMGLTRWCTSIIFVLSGLNLRSREADKALAAWPAGLFGLVSILLITPLAAIPILHLQSSPRELVAGLAIFACVPTTLSSAVCLTQIAGANITLALGMTVLSNLISIVTSIDVLPTEGQKSKRKEPDQMPFTLTTFVGGGMGVSIPPGPLLKSLIQTLLLPLLLGKVPWMQLSSSKDLLLQIEPSSLLFVAAAGLALHLVYLAANSIMMKIIPSPCMHDDYNSRAILLVTSQKSIIVTLAVIDRLGGALGNAGLLVLPCIAAQFTQVITDSMLVNKWLQSDARKQVPVVAA